ncbi:MAG: TonB-dependent receptor [Bryobacterales bacterium]|nr:TonB-dependent receptor [Bryobacterales bacterium]
MRYVVRLTCLCALAGGAFGQGDRGTITGTVTDPSGAVVAGAKVRAENAATHNAIETVTTETGNFTLAQVPVGSWDVAVEAAGFKKFTSVNNIIEVAQTIRVDARLDVGANSETVSVEAQAVAIRTESADVTTTVPNQLFVELPIQWSNGFYGNQAVRNPLSVAQILPGMSGGTSYFGSLGLTGGGAAINGAPPGTFKTLVDGQDATNIYAPGFFFYQQPSVEALEEVSLQAGNYAAEFGQAQGGIYNFTAKSGTNIYHGGLFYRLTNEVLNAHQPYTGARAASRQNNFGGTFGGPVWIPHVYDGHNRTFFFFSFEGFRSVLPVPNSGTFTTVPNANDRAGNFQADLGGQVNCGGTPCKDALGNPVLAGQIFDPLALAPDGFTRFPFPNNTIPASRIDRVALKIQDFLPNPINSLQALNYQLSGTTPRPQNLPSIKVDHNFSERLKLSTFYSFVGGSGQTSTDGLPTNITVSGFNHSSSSTARVNVDHTIRPSILLHLGAGYVNTQVSKLSFPDVASFDQTSKLGLTGAIYPGFPQMSGLGNFSASGAPIGGMPLNFGSNFNQYVNTGEFTSSAALSWVKGSHSYKFGTSGYTRMEGFNQCQGGWGSYVFSAAQTGQPFSAGGVTLVTTNGSPGLGYASFLLGLPASASISPCTSVNWHDRALAFYAQDNWKVTRRLTLDLGLRYDLQNPPLEDRNRISSFSFTAPNPSAGNLPGAVLYQGFGPGACNCDDFLNLYKFAFGPRLGAAYQINSKTVIRAAWGFFYGGPQTFLVSAPQAPGAGTGYDTIAFSAPRPGASALPNGLQGGLTVNTALFAATLHQPGALPTSNPATGLSNLNAPAVYDPGLGRPPRISQYNVALQRELVPGMTLEAAWVGSRGAWLQGTMYQYNSVTPAILAARGLSLSNAANLTLLNSQISSSAVKAAGFSLPFSNFPPSTTLTNALRPFPQFGAVNPNASVGNSWYDSLQTKLNARLKYNITALGTYTWAKSLARISNFNDWTAFNTQKALDVNSIPQALSLNLIYQTPHLKSGFLGSNKIARNVLSDWQVSSVLRYQSGALITAPLSNDNLGIYLAGAALQYMTRVPGQPLYLTDPNGRIDPTQQLLLNPAAWIECGPTATFGCGAPRYTDFRQRRSPQEDIGLGRRFVLSDASPGRLFEIRMEMYNPFNRIVFPNIVVGNPITNPTRNSNGQLTGGFGFMNINNIAAGTARNMLVVARVAF